MTALKKNKLLMMLVIIFMLLNNSIIYAFDLERKISKNVYIGEIDVSDLTIEEATKKVNLYIEENRYFNLIYNDKKIKIDKNTFDLDYKIPQLAQNAYNVGRDKDIITNIKTKVSLKRGNKEIIPIVSYYNISKIDELIKQLNEQFYISPVNATAEVINDKVAVTKGSYGQNINKQQLKSIIIYKIDNLNSKDSEIPITVLKPKYTSKQLSKIDTLLGSYETYFNPKNINRVKKTFKLCLISSLIYSAAAWLLLMTSSEVVVKIFNNDPSLLQITSNSIKIYFAGIFIFGAQISCQQTFLSLGKAKISLFLALLRKIILLIPLIFILPMFVDNGLFAVLLAEPVADVIAALTTVACFTVFYKKTLSKININENNKSIAHF